MPNRFRARAENTEWVRGGWLLEEKGCSRLDDAACARRFPKRPPKEPSSRDWEEWDLPERYPRLVAKYGLETRDWSKERRAHENFRQHMAKGANLAQLLLDASIIPSCGLIPPPRVAREVLRSGRSPSPSARLQSWTPFDLDEGHYWIAARELRQPSVQALKHRPDLAGVTLTIDTEAPSATTYAEWLDSLKARGLMIGK